MDFFTNMSLKNFYILHGIKKPAMFPWKKSMESYFTYY